jgi:ssDNA-binding Zn-finger/Zn-ribbon topoisomerase 1
MLCPQCNAPMVKKTHSGRTSPYNTLNCTHCRFVIFYRGNIQE